MPTKLPSIQQLKSFTLQLALDFNPYDLLTSNQLSESNKFRDQEDWFNRALELAGYRNIERRNPNSFYINVLDLSDENLILFLKKHLEDEKENPMDEMIKLRGGTIVLDAQELLFSPTCCTDITDYNNWLDLEKTDEFKSIWIGHPWILYKTKEEIIYLTDYLEANGDVIDDSKIKYQSTIKAVQDQATHLENIMNDFEIRVNLLLKELGLDDYDKITKCIVKGDCELKF